MLESKIRHMQPAVESLRKNHSAADVDVLCSIKHLSNAMKDRGNGTSHMPRRYDDDEHCHRWVSTTPSMHINKVFND